MFGEAWSPMSVPDLAPDDDDRYLYFCDLILNVVYFFSQFKKIPTT